MIARGTPKAPGSWRFLGRRIAARLCVAGAVALLYAWLLFPLVAPSRGSGGFGGEPIFAEGTVEVHAPWAEMPQLRVSVTQIAGGGSEQTVATIPLTYDQTSAAGQPKADRGTCRLHYSLVFTLVHFRSRPHGLSDAVGEFLNGRRPVARLWHPEDYRLHVCGPEGMQVEPARYVLSALNPEANDFVVRVP